MKQYIKILFFLLLIVTTISCADWLDVKPSDRVTEENAFSTPQSFRKALNGIYIELNRDEIYGKALSVEFIDILAQYYPVNPESRANVDLMNFNYTSSTNLDRISMIWATMYNIIANTNLLIRNCDNRRSVLSDDYYEIIKGEALALRAYLHFDLFRLFGPVYKKDAIDQSIPYYTDFVLNVEPSLRADDFISQVITDLEESLKLLENDPIKTYGPKGDPTDSFKQYRTLRLNYYAVKTLLARVYLYAQEKELALETAMEVMEIQDRWFPWIKPEDASSDRVFSTELLFSLQNMKRRNLYYNFFNARNIEDTRVLAPLQYVTEKMFNYEMHDYRATANLQSTILIGSQNHRIFTKYEAQSDSLWNQLIPLIRISEAFFIAAESEPTPKEGIKHLNIVRNNRGIIASPVDWYFFDDRLSSQYIREFWGEGQLFYFYKRKNKNQIQSPYDEWEIVDVTERNYILPIPEGETKYN